MCIYIFIDLFVQNYNVKDKTALASSMLVTQDNCSFLLHGTQIENLIVKLVSLSKVPLIYHSQLHKRKERKHFMN